MDISRCNKTWTVKIFYILQINLVMYDLQLVIRDYIYDFQEEYVELSMSHFSKQIKNISELFININ